MTNAAGRVDVLGVHISTINRATAVEAIARFIRERAQTYVCVTGVHGVMESRRDPALVDIHNRSGLTTPDGMPMVWAARFAGARPTSRVYGPDLMLDVCERSQQEGWRHYFFGAGEGVAKELAERLVERFPALEVVGTMSPPFGPIPDDEDERIVAELEEARPDIVWVGLSTPKQEHWMAAHRHRLSAPVLVGVGAAFDIHAGRRRQAPLWMQHSGLEWLFRLQQEPRRLWRRYLFNNPRFVAGVVRRPPRLLADASLSGEADLLADASLSDEASPSGEARRGGEPNPNRL